MGRSTFLAIFSGISFFAHGSKSTKLMEAFKSFDADARGTLYADDLHRFLRSFLVAILTVNERASSLPMDQFFHLTDSVIESVVASVMEETGSG